jgi:hypothetical protein
MQLLCLETYAERHVESGLHFLAQSTLVYTRIPAPRADYC